MALTALKQWKQGVSVIKYKPFPFLYPLSLYFPVLDSFLAELRRRFDDKNMDVMHAIQACNPQSKYFLSPSVLKPLVEMYNLDIEVV